MEAIQIQGINAEELLQRIRSEMEAVIAPATTLATSSELLNTLIDRAFITRNLKISYHRIMIYENERVLTRVMNINDSKGVYYRLSDYIRLEELEADRLFPNRNKK